MSVCGSKIHERLAHFFIDIYKLFHISDEQMAYITNANAGCGLIRYGSDLVPFENHFARDTDLYALMNTKPGEDQ